LLRFCLVEQALREAKLLFHALLFPSVQFVLLVDVGVQVKLPGVLLTEVNLLAIEVRLIALILPQPQLVRSQLVTLPIKMHLVLAVEVALELDLPELGFTHL